MYLVLLICNKRVAFSLSFIVKVSLLFVICYVYVWNLHVLEKHQKKTIWTRLSHWKHKLSVWTRLSTKQHSKHHHQRWISTLNSVKVQFTWLTMYFNPKRICNQIHNKNMLKRHFALPPLVSYHTLSGKKLYFTVDSIVSLYPNPKRIS